MNEEQESPPKTFWWKNKQPLETCQALLKPGDLCPNCGDAPIDYDGLFILICPECQHVAEAGAFT